MTTSAGAALKFKPLSHILFNDLLCISFNKYISQRCSKSPGQSIKIEITHDNILEYLIWISPDTKTSHSAKALHNRQRPQNGGG